MRYGGGLRTKGGRRGEKGVCEQKETYFLPQNHMNYDIVLHTSLHSITAVLCVCAGRQRLVLSGGLRELAWECEWG